MCRSTRQLAYSVALCFDDEQNGGIVRSSFQTLKQLQPLLNPTDFTVDFEKAAINAIENAFPMAEIHCCNFHFGQNVFRKVQQVGLQSVYTVFEEFCRNLCIKV